MNNSISNSRRTFVKFGVGVLGTGGLTALLGNKLLADVPKTNPKSGLAPDLALAELMRGNQRFTDRQAKHPNQDLSRMLSVSKKQQPFAAILGCADSRVPLEIVFDRGIGDLFVARVAGNTATDEITGTLEYGTLVSGAKVVMVLGHKNCGAVRATIDNQAVPGKIGSLLTLIKPAVASTKSQSGDRLKNAVVANIKNQVDRLKSSEVISKLITENKLKVVGGYYDLDNGMVTLI